MKASDVLEPNEPIVLPPSKAALGGVFYRIVVASTALGLGCMAAVFEALRQEAGGFTFRISAWTFVAFAVGAVAGILYWKMAARSLLAARVNTGAAVVIRSRWISYPLRFVPSDKMTDIAVGLARPLVFCLWGPICY